MLRLIRKKIYRMRNECLKCFVKEKQKLGQQTGQVAVILLFIVGIALIFYAVTMNVGKNNQIKTQVTIASNLGAARLSSQLASYGQQIYYETLGGEWKVCGWTGFMKALITFIVVMIVIVLTIISVGTVGIMLWIALGAAVGSLVIQGSVLQPALTAMWNNSLMPNLPLQDRFMEQALQSALEKAVTDTAEIPDLNDFDQDMRYGFDPLTGEPLDTINRYGYYYTKRLQFAQPPLVPQAIEFRDALVPFIEKLADPLDWGMLDVDSANPFCEDGMSECNECCVNDDFSSLGSSREEMGCLDTAAEEPLCNDMSPFPGWQDTCY